MYKRNKIVATSIKSNNSYEGETIETKIERIVNNNEPITDGAPIIHTERKDGVQPEYNIRNDKWETAVDAMDTVANEHRTAREKRMKIVKDGEENEGGNEGETGEQGGKNQ